MRVYLVVGGGAAGCAAAAVLSREGHEVTLFEASGELGGRTRTVERDGFGVEVGAIYLLNSYTHTIGLLNDVGRGGVVQPWSPLAGLWDGAVLHPIRYDYIPSFFRFPMLSVRDKVRLALRAAQIIASPAPDPFETESLAQFDTGDNMEMWARKRLGDNLFECFVRPLIEPSFGTDCRDLSVPYLQGVMKRAHRSKFFLPVEGMGSVCRALTAKVDVRLDTQVTGVEVDGQEVVVRTTDGQVVRADGVVIATDAPQTASLLDGQIGPDLAQSLRSVPYASMAHVNLRWRKDPWPNSEFEMLLPIGAGPRDILGTIVKTSRNAKELVPAGARMTNSYFSSESTRRLSDGELVEATLRHVAKILGDGAPEPEAEVFRSERALATCPPGHYRAMSRLRGAMPPRIAVAGDYLAHLGVETAVVSGEHAAGNLIATAPPARR
ncbi:protoporphyrinogen/coproporphyrinogen oxidase [Mycobacterium sp. C31M]